MENPDYPCKVNLVRYADDFIVTADKRETLRRNKGNVDSLFKAKERGLYTIREKTLITHISDGFDFWASMYGSTTEHC